MLDWGGTGGTPGDAETAAEATLEVASAVGLVRPARFERATNGFEDRYSIH